MDGRSTQVCLKTTVRIWLSECQKSTCTSRSDLNFGYSFFCCSFSQFTVNRFWWSTHSFSDTSGFHFVRHDRGPTCGFVCQTVIQKKWEIHSGTWDCRWRTNFHSQSLPTKTFYSYRSMDTTGDPVGRFSKWQACRSHRTNVCCVIYCHSKFLWSKLLCYTT